MSGFVMGSSLQLLCFRKTSVILLLYRRTEVGEKAIVKLLKNLSTEVTEEGQIIIRS